MLTKLSDIPGPVCYLRMKRGPGAALLMSSTRSILRGIAERGLPPPAEVLHKANEILVKDFPKTRFDTMIYAVIKPLDNIIIFSNAGHPPPVFADSIGVKQLNYESGLPLGIQESNFHQHSIKMTKGSRLLLYSDGISEAMNASEDEYGEEQIMHQMSDPSAAIASILHDVKIFTEGTTPSDDMTLVLIKS